MNNIIRYFKSVAVAMFSAVLLWSCSDDKDEPVAVSTLPEAAQTFLTSHYAGVKVQSAVRDKDDHRVEFDVRLANGHEVTFDAEGNWIDVDAPAGQTVPGGLVPEAVLLYIVTNYPSEGINEISRSAAGYDVDLTNGVDLEFDFLGNFLRADR